MFKVKLDLYLDGSSLEYVKNLIKEKELNSTFNLLISSLAKGNHLLTVSEIYEVLETLMQDDEEQKQEEEGEHLYSDLVEDNEEDEEDLFDDIEVDKEGGDEEDLFGGIEVDKDEQPATEGNSLDERSEEHTMESNTIDISELKTFISEEFIKLKDSLISSGGVIISSKEVSKSDSTQSVEEEDDFNFDDLGLDDSSDGEAELTTEDFTKMFKLLHG